MVHMLISCDKVFLTDRTYYDCETVVDKDLPNEVPEMYSGISAIGLEPPRSVCRCV